MRWQWLALAVIGTQVASGYPAADFLLMAGIQAFGYVPHSRALLYLVLSHKIRLGLRRHGAHLAGLSRRFGVTPPPRRLTSGTGFGL